MTKRRARPDIEAQLADARARLEAAAREVAELSGQLTGPIMQDYMIAGVAGMPSRAMLGINLGDDHAGERRRAGAERDAWWARERRWFACR